MEACIERTHMQENPEKSRNRQHVLKIFSGFKCLWADHIKKWA